MFTALLAQNSCPTELWVLPDSTTAPHSGSRPQSKQLHTAGSGLLEVWSGLCSNLACYSEGGTRDDMRFKRDVALGSTANVAQAPNTECQGNEALVGPDGGRGRDDGACCSLSSQESKTGARGQPGQWSKYSQGHTQDSILKQNKTKKQKQT